MKRVAGLLLLASFIALAVRQFVGHPVRIRTSSMAPGLWPGDLVWVWVGETPVRGDGVLWRPAEGEQTLARRVVGIEGDLVEVQHGGLTVNGVSAASDGSRNAWLPVGDGTRVARQAVVEVHQEQSVLVLPGGGDAHEAIPAGHFYLLGDHRAVSEDSRQWGPTARQNILGVLGPVIWMSRPE